ncbi:MAG: ABC transporter ATP-binding protein [Actinomycetota bacterium]|nr:ABC transporter ATP-binding protein [Actinomycetota bacterium]
MEGGAVLEVEGLTKRYAGRLALDDVSLRVMPGEVCGLLGPNGAGKTTLVSIVAGLRSADGGVVRVDGRDVAEGGRAARSAIGLAAQETGIYPTVTVRANLELFAGLAGLSGRATGTRLAEVSEILELDHLLDRQARHLSGGEKRRLHTAMAMVHRPRLLMLDEPTTGVDIATRSRLLDAIARLAQEEGCAVLYSTHYLPEVEQLGASVSILDHGRILVRGSLDQLVAAYGGGVVELTFEGPAPALPRADIDGSVARVVTDDHPGPMAAAVLGSLGADAERLVSVDLVRPSLETVFLALTGRTYTSDAGVAVGAGTETVEDNA